DGGSDGVRLLDRHAARVVDRLFGLARRLVDARGDDLGIEARLAQELEPPRRGRRQHQPRNHRRGHCRSFTFSRSNTQLLSRKVDKLFVWAMAVTEPLKGSARRVVFPAPDGSFAVLRPQVAGRDEPVAVVGPLAESTAGELLKLEGAWERHPTHGEQFR